MGYSVVLILALCCQLTKSVGPPNPESDPNCIPVESVTRDNRTWNNEDQVFVCQLYGNRIDIFSLAKNQAIAAIQLYRISLKELWGLSIRFTDSYADKTWNNRLTFSQIEHAQAFFARVQPRGRVSPQNFTSRGLDQISVKRGAFQDRKTVTNKQLVFHQYFINPDTMKFTFEEADGSTASEPLVTFLKEGFQFLRFQPYTEIMMAPRGREFYILKFGDSATSSAFTNYITMFADTGPRYIFPHGYEE